MKVAQSGLTLCDSMDLKVSVYEFGRGHSPVLNLLNEQV